MVNALRPEIMDDVSLRTRDYIYRLKTDDATFLEYLAHNRNFSNDYDVLVAICKQNPEFVCSEYFRERKKRIINGYMNNMKLGRLIQNGDNLVIVGSPYAMLLHAVGEDPESDPTFECEAEATQCWTERFKADEYLAAFRSPFNSQNNIDYLHNVYHEYFTKYFNLGRLIIAVNMVHTDFQDKNNGSDMDSDSIYTTNQPDIVEHAKQCQSEYPTIVNNIPKEKNNYSSSMVDFAYVDNNLAHSQRAIGESSNLAQICLTYGFNYDDQKYVDDACILAVVAQAAIDSAKRRFDIDISSEIKRIRDDIEIDTHGYPRFWLQIRKGFNENKINQSLVCPMNNVCDIKVPSYNPIHGTIPTENFIISYEDNEIAGGVSKHVEELIIKYSVKLGNYRISGDYTDFDPGDADDGENFLRMVEFDELIQDIRAISLPGKYLPLVSYFINRIFDPTLEKSVALNKNRPLVLRVLYELSPEAVLACFGADVKKSFKKYKHCPLIEEIPSANID